ncbi:GNAT family N-acetyltransferase [Flagellimonas sp.]|uniref:GNAT family N-acetyltransferase n=1 Tax=Flagellimonas sp. TaxID=2058762 RepID=UPI003B510495
MNNYIIDHLFEFWEYIGSQGGFFTSDKGFNYCNPGDMSWPSKVFGIECEKVDFKHLHLKMNSGTIPNSLGIAEDELTEKLLFAHNFEKTSEVKGMFLNLLEAKKPEDHFPTIKKVNTELSATKFAEVASESFGYRIYPRTILSLLNSEEKIELYLGIHNGTFVNCGIIFLDKNNVSGIHMIGTIPEYRGIGLGKIMTNKLLSVAFENESDTVVLVASESGERIYTKMGFVADKSLKSYSAKNNVLQYGI